MASLKVYQQKKNKKEREMARNNAIPFFRNKTEGGDF
jgi:hypothetical protein